LPRVGEVQSRLQKLGAHDLGGSGRGEEKVAGRSMNLGQALRSICLGRIGRPPVNAKIATVCSS